MDNLKSDKIDFKPKLIRSHGEGYYLIIKEKIQVDITVLNIYMLNRRASNFINEQTLLDIKSYIDPDT